MISFALLGLTACATVPDAEKTLSPYLNEFIGKDVQYVKQHINLQQLDFKSSNRPYSETDQQLTYRILRPINIPVPIPTATGLSGGSRPFAASSFNHSTANSYKMDLNCDIHFNLKDNKVVNWTYKGKAC